jgi:hypothetical protein
MGSATVVISETNGIPASEVITDNISNVNFGSDDSPNLIPATYPIVAQADGHSYEKWLRLKVTDLGLASAIDNFKVWLSNLGGGWAVGEGISCNLVTSGYSEASYPAGGPVDTDSSDATVSMPESEPAGANVGISGSLSGTITAADEYTDYFVLQLDVSASTPSGSVNQKEITVQWDEQ